MSRAARRDVPPDDSSLPSVDTVFLRKLIQTGDTGFVDDLVGKPSSSATMHTTTRSSNRRSWPYILLGMMLMYLLISLWEFRKTRDWWSSYMSNLQQSDTTAMALRGGKNSQTENSIFKSISWQQGTAGGFMASAGGNDQATQGGLRNSGTLGGGGISSLGGTMLGVSSSGSLLNPPPLGGMAGSSNLFVQQHQQQQPPPPPNLFGQQLAPQGELVVAN
jgi:hypothetical protein